MDYFKIIFWIGFIVLLVSHLLMINGAMRQHALIALTGTGCMFIGSKIGREFLGIN